jgi:hypothetical protein
MVTSSASIEIEKSDRQRSPAVRNYRFRTNGSAPNPFFSAGI